MIKKTITYPDYIDGERTEDFYFNLSQAELIEMELTTVGGYKKLIENIIAAQDLPNLFKYFKELILKSYGVKSADGKQFIKIDKDGRRLVDDFVQTEAYSQLLTELVTNTKAASDFTNGIMPSTINGKPIPIPETK